LTQPGFARMGRRELDIRVSPNIVHSVPVGLARRKGAAAKAVDAAYGAGARPRRAPQASSPRDILSPLPGQSFHAPVTIGSAGSCVDTRATKGALGATDGSPGRTRRPPGKFRVSLGGPAFHILTQCHVFTINYKEQFQRRHYRPHSSQGYRLIEQGCGRDSGARRAQH